MCYQLVWAGTWIRFPHTTSRHLVSLPLSTVPHVPVYAERPRRWACKGRLGPTGPPARRHREFVAHRGTRSVGGFQLQAWDSCAGTYPISTGICVLGCFEQARHDTRFPPPQLSHTRRLYDVLICNGCGRQTSIGLSALAVAHFHFLRTGQEIEVHVDARHAILEFSKPAHTGRRTQHTFAGTCSLSFFSFVAQTAKSTTRSMASSHSTRASTSSRIYSRPKTAM